jgi:hypothetical protein
MPGAGGKIFSPEIGRCRSKADRSASIIRCRQIGHAPNCQSAILYGPDGRHNPPVYACGSDYRPFIPTLSNIIYMTGVDLRISDPYGVAHYEVDSSSVSGSTIVLKVYETGAHFRRTVVSPIEAPSGG